MSIPDHTKNYREWRDYYEEDELMEARRHMCPVCGKIFPTPAEFYHIDGILRGICKEHKEVLRVIRILKALDNEVLGKDFTPVTVALKLAEEGMI